MEGKILKERILLKMDEKEEKTASGLILPNVAQKDTDTGVVVMIGKGVDEVVVGDRLDVSPHAGTTITIDDNPYRLIQNRDVRYIYPLQTKQ